MSTFLPSNRDAWAKCLSDFVNVGASTLDMAGFSQDIDYNIENIVFNRIIRDNDILIGNNPKESCFRADPTNGMWAWSYISTCDKCDVKGKGLLKVIRKDNLWFITGNYYVCECH